LSNAETFRQRLEILYGEALDAKKVDVSQVRGRANALIESYNGLRHELKESIAPDLNIPELEQVSTRFEDFNALP